MTAETPDLQSLAYQLEALRERLQNLEVQVRGLMTSQTVEAKAFVLRDDRGRICARLDIQGYSPRLTFFDRGGDERLSVGLRSEGSPSLRVKDREIPVGTL